MPPPDRPSATHPSASAPHSAPRPAERPLAPTHAAPRAPSGSVGMQNALRMQTTYAGRAAPQRGRANGRQRAETLSKQDSGTSSDKELHRVNSTGFLSDIGHVAPVMQRKGQRNRVDTLQDKSRDLSISHAELKELAATRHALTNDVDALMTHGSDGKEIGIHPWTARNYFGSKTAGELGVTTGIHTTTSAVNAGYIQAGINPHMSDPKGRLGAAFYVANSRQTSREEISHHNAPIHDELSYQTTDRGKFLDLTHPVDRKVVANRSEAEQKRDGGRANRGDLIREATMDAHMAGAAAPSMRNPGGTNLAIYAEKHDEKSPVNANKVLGVTSGHRGTITNSWSEQDRDTDKAKRTAAHETASQPPRKKMHAVLHELAKNHNKGSTR